MKKNGIMRVFTLLLVLTLVSTCAISGTFAKYITKAEGADQARVAKWGIVLTMEGDGMFKNEYEADDETFTGDQISASVKSSDDAKVVAPGTKGDGLKATVKGTPEVATRYILEIPANWADVSLKAGEYTDYTKLVQADDGTYGYTDTFKLDKDYGPVKWDISVKKGSTSISLTQVAQAYPALAAAMGGNEYGFSATNAKDIVTRYATQLQNLIETMVSGASNAKFEVNDDGSIRLSMDFDAGKEMDFEFGLKWAWEFSDAEGETDVSLNDKADTYLGNVAAGVITDDSASTDLSFKFTATAVQID